MDHSAGRKYRLLFLTVNSSYSHSSLALPLLHSACREVTNWEWLRYDMTLDSDIMSAVREICSFKCDLLVTTLYLFNRTRALEVLSRCRTILPECTIAVGGPECLGEGGADLLKSYPWINTVFRGEGERIFREYLETFDKNSPAPHSMIPPEGNAVFQEWESAPSPASDPFFVADKPFVQIETTRGCPMKCTYCTSGGTLPRYRTLEQVRSELQILAAKGVREIRVLDRTFNLPQERGAALLAMFRKEFPQMRFHLELHPQFLNDSLRHEMSSALPGQLHVEVGVQCLDAEVQRLCGRNSNSQKVLEGLDFLCQQPGFETHADLLGGLPGQKWEHIIADTTTLMEHNIAEIQLEILKVLPGTPLREIAPLHNIRFSPKTPYDVMMSDTMTLEDIQHVRDLSRLLDMTCNHRALHQAVLVMSRECPEFVSRLLEFFHRAGGNASVVWNLQKRFLFLRDFCRCHHLEQGAFELAYHWLLAGLPPEQGADAYSQKTQGVPLDALLLSGPLECAAARETRFITLAFKEKRYYLAYNRKYALNLPAAVWLLETPFPS